MLTLPTNSGWTVQWYTGQRIIRRKRNGRASKVIRLTDSFTSVSKEKVESKAAELVKQGYEIRGIYECIF